MTTEIERKFLVDHIDFLGNLTGKAIRQGYVAITEDAITRVRVKGDHAYLTIKGKTVGIRRREFEYEIPVEDAHDMLDALCANIISKTRYSMDVDGLEWVIDVFEGDNEGLVVAEVELEDEHQPYTKPSWATEEVSHDHRYFNSYISEHPYNTWPETKT